MTAVFRFLAALLLTLAASGALLLADQPQPAPDDSAAENASDSPAADSETAPQEPLSDEAGTADLDSDDGTPAAEEAASETPGAEPNGKGDEPNEKTSEPERPSVDPEKSPRPKPQPAKPDGTATATPNGKYRLQYKFKAGEMIRWEVVHRAVVDSTIQGSNQTAETRTTSVKLWKVTGVSLKGEVTLVHSIESLDLWQKTQGRQEVRYNSRSDEKVPQGYEEVATAVGVPLTLVTLDRHGKVLNREEKHKQSNPSNMPLTIPLPEDPVSIGYTWSMPADVDVILKQGASRKIQTKQKFTLEKVSDGVATIAMETQILTPLNDPAIEAQLVQRMTNGTLLFDLERGRVISQQLDLDRRVVGFSGASSSMHYVTRFTEELLPADTPPASTAAKKRAPAATANEPATASVVPNKPGAKPAPPKPPASATRTPAPPRR